uniref:Uncharacterized protein n=1 Tax=Melopsittacus undulatus TaxID=13146 RepID=A0A8V5H1V2_MELUD
PSPCIQPGLEHCQGWGSHRQSCIHFTCNLSQSRTTHHQITKLPHPHNMKNGKMCALDSLSWIQVFLYT